MAKKAAKKKTGGKAAKKTIKKKFARAAAKPVRKGKPAKSAKPVIKAARSAKATKNAKAARKPTRAKTSSKSLRNMAKGTANANVQMPVAVEIETAEVIEVEEDGDDQDEEVDPPSQQMTGVTLEHAKKITPEKSSEFAIEVARMIRDDKCEDVVVLDVRGRSPVTDYLVIGSGTSDRQMRSVLQHVEDYGAKTGNDAVRRSIDERATWILADFVDVVVHLFEPNTRAHYDLEMLWGDSKRVAWERPDQVSRDYAGLNS